MRDLLSQAQINEIIDSDQEDLLDDMMKEQKKTSGGAAATKNNIWQQDIFNPKIKLQTPSILTVKPNKKPNQSLFASKTDLTTSKENTKKQT